MGNFLKTASLNSIVRIFAYFLLSEVVHAEERDIGLSSGKVQSLKIDDESVYVLHPINPPASDTAFYLIQAHSHLNNLTISFNKTISYTTSVTATSAGLVQLAYDSTQPTWYLRSAANVTIDTKVLLSEYSNSDPIPGACSTEFPLELDPNIHVFDDHWATTISFQYGNLPTASSVLADCETSQQSKLSYEIYYHFLPMWDISESAYLSALENFLTPNDVIENGKKVATLSSPQETWKVVTSYRGLGVFFTVVVKDGSHTAAYVPRATYSCSDCENDDHILEKVIATTLGVLGLILCCVGHGAYRLVVLIQAGILYAFGCCVGLHFYSDFTFQADIGLSVAAGVLGGLITLGFWELTGASVITTLVCYLPAGYLFSSALYYTPLGNISVMDTWYVYGICFACAVVLPVPFLLCKPRVMSIVSCAWTGSLCVISALAVYVGGSLWLMLVFSIRRQISEAVNSATILPPYYTSDLMLTAGGIGLFILSVLWQVWLVRGKPEFPPTRRERSARPRLPSDNVDEDIVRRPLLPPTRSNSQGSVTQQRVPPQRAPWLESPGYSPQTANLERSEDFLEAENHSPPPSYGSLNHTE